MNKYDYFINNIFYNDFWPTFLFVNEYPLLAVLWNFFLVFIPWLLAYYFGSYYQKTKFITIKQKIVAILIWFLWFLFLPNAAYIITDARHISGFCPVFPYRICLNNAWMIMFFFWYSIMGWIFFVYLLKQMKKILQEIFSLRLATGIIYGLIPFVALGVLLGLINRWNSWEFFLNPLSLFNDVILYFTNLTYFKNWLAFSFSLFLLYYLGDIMFKDFSSKTKNNVRFWQSCKRKLKQILPARKKE